MLEVLFQEEKMWIYGLTNPLITRLYPVMDIHIATLFQNRFELVKEIFMEELNQHHQHCMTLNFSGEAREWSYSWGRLISLGLDAEPLPTSSSKKSSASHQLSCKIQQIPSYNVYYQEVESSTIEICIGRSALLYNS